MCGHATGGRESTRTQSAVASLTVTLSASPRWVVVIGGDAAAPVGVCGDILRDVDVVLCPSCGEENPAKFRLCGYCGTPLAQGAADAPAAPAPAPVVEARLPPREIRKTVTLLFTDLKD